MMLEETGHKNHAATDIFWFLIKLYFNEPLTTIGLKWLGLLLIQALVVTLRGQISVKMY